jgi:hypothetical protein
MYSMSVRSKTHGDKSVGRAADKEAYTVHIINIIPHWQ